MRRGVVQNLLHESADAMSVVPYRRPKVNPEGLVFLAHPVREAAPQDVIPFL